MDMDVMQDFLLDEDANHGVSDVQEDLEYLKFWVAIIISSWYLVGFSKGLR